MSDGRVVVYVGDDRARVLDGVADTPEWTLRRAEGVREAQSMVAAADCVVSEATLPDGTGLELYDVVRGSRPDVPFVLLAEGAGDPALARAAVDAGVTKYVPLETLDGPTAFRDLLAETVGDVERPEPQYGRLVEHTSEVVWVLDRDGGVEYVDPTVETALGYEPAALAGADIRSLIHEDDRAETRQRLADAVEAPGETVGVECRVERADGDWCWVEARARGFVDDRSAGDVVLAVRDIDARKERERELELYERMLSAVPDMVYAVDEDGQFLAVNEAAEAVAGYSQADLIGRHASVVMDEADVETGEAVVRRLLRDDDTDQATFEMTLQTADGEAIPVENHLALLRGEDGSFRGSVGAVRDISDRARRKRRLTVLNRALRHDLRNSMHVVLANAELAETEVDDPDIAEKLRTIQRRASQITDLSEKAREIDEILRNPAGTRRAVDLSEMLETQLAAFREQYPAATIEASLPDEAVATVVDRIDVAVENLVENSIQHTEDAHVEVDVTVDEETVTLSVADDGPGIPERERRVVDQGVETPLAHTSGLGLWLAAWIARDSGGDIVFGECDDGGSVVSLELERGSASPDAELGE